MNPKVDVANGRLIIIDNYLFPDDLVEDHSFLQDMTEVLSLLQSGVRVFQHLLARSNVTKLLKQGKVFFKMNTFFYLFPIQSRVLTVVVSGHL